MHRKFIKSGAVLATTLIGLSVAGTTHASVTADASGKGFVGKGDVQTAFGWSNKALQDAVKDEALSFRGEVDTTTALTQQLEMAGTQAGTQSGTQSGTQAGTQAATQLVGQDLTCTFTNGNGTKVFHRDGVRDGERTGTREGTRLGTREGTRECPGRPRQSGTGPART